MACHTGVVTASPRTKATRDDWIQAAVDRLTVEPIDQLKILSLAGDIGVSRSSFYWYFDDPAELRQELLERWQHNTTSIVERSCRRTDTPVAACLAVFECWADSSAYDAALDLAVRDWGRRDTAVAAQVADADATRLEALTVMFGRHGFDDVESLVRARLLYHSQVGYYAVGTAESMQTRLSYVDYYLDALAGTRPTKAELAGFKHFLGTLDNEPKQMQPGPGT